MFLQTKYEVKKWLVKYEIENYIINDDLTVDVNGSVNLFCKQLKYISIKFNIVIGNFICSSNQLTTLEFAPKYVGGNFWCCSNQLTTLEFAPKYVGKSFECSHNLLITLEGAPKNINGHFYCHYNRFTTLQGSPEIIGTHFYYFGDYQLSSLKGAPKNKLKQIIKKYPNLIHTLSTEDLLGIRNCYQI